MKRLAQFGLLILVAACQDQSNPPVGPANPGTPQFAADSEDRQGESKPDGAFGIQSSGLSTVAIASGTVTAADLAQTLVGSGVAISNVVYSGHPTAAGRFAGGTGIIGFEEGIILSSGRVQDVVGPNQVDGVTTVHLTPGDPQLAALTGRNSHDAAILSFDFVPSGDKVFIEYVFTSDEYNEYVHRPFDDAFAFFVNGQNCATVGSPPQRVSVNTIHNGNPFGSAPTKNPHLYRNNDLSDGGGSINTEMDGLTVVLVCEADVNRDVINTMRLSISDISDRLLDSNVFLKAGSFSTTPPVNQPPVANAGPDQTVQCTSHGGSAVGLDGSASTDSDGTIVDFRWLDASGNVVASGPTPTVNLAKGSHTLTLQVTDDVGAVSTDDVVINVVDTTAPALAASASPNRLWPVNHKYVEVVLTVNASDACDGAPVVSGSVVSSELDDAIGSGDGNTTGDIRVTRADGTVLLSSNANPQVAFAPGDKLELRAERFGVATGREYTVTLTATDASGNSTTRTVTVTVPHNQP